MMRRGAASALAALAALGMTACAPAPPASRSPAASAAVATTSAESEDPGLAPRLAATMLPLAARAEAADGAGTGSVVGRVSWQGAAPLKIKQLTNDVDVETCGARVQPGSVVAGPAGEIAHVVLELRRASAPRQGLAKAFHDGPPVSVSIERCLQQPHVLLVPLGAGVDVENRDGILHELVGLAVRNPPFEADLPRYRRRALIESEALARPERIKVTCETHPWAVAWWVVTGTPHHALSGRDGRFEIAGVPAGTWKLVAWHEEFGEIERTVDVRSGAPAIVELAYR